MVEFLLGRYCASVDEQEIQEGLEIVEKQLRDRTVRTGEEELFKARAKEQGSIKLIDLVRARLDARNDCYVAELPSLALKDVRIAGRLVRDNERMLTDGFYAEVTLSYDAIVAQENNGRPFAIDTLRPIQMSKSDALDVLARGRMKFSLFFRSISGHSRPNCSDALIPVCKETMNSQRWCRSCLAESKCPFFTSASIRTWMTVDVHLEVGSASESVTANGSGVEINTTDGSVSTVIDRQFVQNIPLNGRSFQDLISLTPGVVRTSPEDGGILGVSGDFSVNGQRTESNNYIVDGLSANFSAGNEGGTGDAAGNVAAVTALGTSQALMSIDDLQEFRVESSSYSAEYGGAGEPIYLCHSLWNQPTSWDRLRLSAQ